MKISKIISVVTLSAFLVCTACSCTKEDKYRTDEVKNFAEVSQLQAIEDSKTVAENDRFTLSWNKDDCNVILTDKSNGKVWSTSPIDKNTGAVIADDNNLFSPINMEYVMKSAFRTIEVTGKQGAMIDGEVKSRLIDKGIELTFVFTKYQIAVPVEFKLHNTGLEVSVNLANIGENASTADYRIFAISLAPYLCSVDNSTENYLFVPSGSGALMYTDIRDNGIARSFEGKVYGDDATEEKKYQDSTTKFVRMPVFGANETNNTMSAIITDGSEMATVKANVGDAITTVSNAYSKFRVRGYNSSVMEYGGATGNAQVRYYSYDRVSEGKISVMYTPVVSEKEGYVEIANNYRNHLVKEYGLTSGADDKLLSLEYLGALRVKDHFLGIPYTKTVSLTQINDITESLKKLSAFNNIDVKLKGFGESGITFGKLGGGFEVTSKTGGKKDISAFNEYCKENGISQYFDFDLIYFNKSGNGFSTSKDNSSTANGYPAERNVFSPTTNTVLKGSKPASLLARGQLNEALEKALKATEKYGFTGVALDTVSQTIYSDYGETKYSNVGNIKQDVLALIESAKKDGNKLAVSDANDFAAVGADKIFDAPLASAKLTSLDTDIPFYQIVFKGYVPLSGESINISSSARGQFLKSLSVGSALQFSLIGSYTTDYTAYLNKDIHSMVIDNNLEDIISLVNEGKNVLEKVKGKNITDYTVIDENVRKTVFDNGTEIYINLGDKAYTYNGITIPAEGFEVR